jgi:hypothetical protein
MIAILRFRGHVIHRWKGILITFLSGILKIHQILKNSVGKPRKQICICLMSADQGGQKNRNGKMTAVPFLPCLLLVHVEF